MSAAPHADYVFAELDNLEYSVEKYRLGYMSVDLAQRALLTFLHRCRWRRFRTLVVELLDGRTDYTQPTRTLVGAICAA